MLDLENLVLLLTSKVSRNLYFLEDGGRRKVLQGLSGNSSSLTIALGEGQHRPAVSDVDMAATYDTWVPTQGCTGPSEGLCSPPSDAKIESDLSRFFVPFCFLVWLFQPCRTTFLPPPPAGSSSCIFH